MFEEKIKDLVISSLVVDSYCLGTHWVYDEQQLINNSINWNALNAPIVLWHKGKLAGDFTHYGDQTLWLYEFLKDKNSFDAKAYEAFWFEKMQTYKGYVDASSRNSIENIQNKIEPCGSSSTDLSIVGRIAALLKVSKTKEEFYKNVEKFVSITHNSEKAKQCADFFAKLLILVLEKNDIKESIIKLKDTCDEYFQNMIENALNSKEEDSFKAIRDFGPACGIDGGFSGVIYLLTKYDNLKQMIISNSKAGGDTSARAMIATLIFMANNEIGQLPKEWMNINAKI